MTDGREDHDGRDWREQWMERLDRGSPRIPGTWLPDNPIHRASLWIQTLEFDAADELVDRGVERTSDEEIGRLRDELDLEVTVGDLKVAVQYYGMLCAQSYVPQSINISVPVPAGKGMTTMANLMHAIWFDGFKHGAATQAGKSAQSIDERLT